MAWDFFDALSLAARRALRRQDAWQANEVRKLPGGWLVTGAVSPPYARGPRKGEPNWPRRDRATQAAVLVSPQALARAKATLSATSTKPVGAAA